MKNLWAERFKLLTSPLRMVPDFIIPGETKCGTTTFFRCIEKHPDIASPDMKEPNNFIRYGGTSIFCRMHFPFYFRKLLSPGMITGEASVEYLSKDHTPFSIYSLVPDVKLIIMLRNPIRRALSDYLMMKDSGREPETFDQVVEKTVSWLTDESLERLVAVARKADDTPLRYLTKGCYSRTIRPWLEMFPRENIRIIKSETFFEKPQDVLDEIFEFLGVKAYRLESVPHHRKARLSVPVSSKSVMLLDDFFRPFNEELVALLGEEFSWQVDTEELLETCSQS